MSWWSSFFHPEKSYQSAQDELNKYFQQSQGALNPYNQHGQEAYGGLNTAMQRLLNPMGLQDEWSKGYKESDLAKQNEAMASQSGLNAAQQMGLGGSSPALQAIQSGTANIVSQDRQKYLDDLMQKYLAGAGIGQNLYNTGAGAAGQMSQNFMNQGQNAAQLKFNQMNAPGDLFGKLLGFGAGAFGGPLGAGFAQKMGWSPKGSYNPAPQYRR